MGSGARDFSIADYRRLRITIHPKGVNPATRHVVVSPLYPSELIPRAFRPLLNFRTTPGVPELTRAPVFI